MNDIKPDTSLYEDFPNKLRALALVLEAPPVEWQFLFKSGWGQTLVGPDSAIECLARGSQCRLKPKPRDLWSVYEANGFSRVGTYTSESVADEIARTHGRTVVRFVEQPE